MFRTEHIQTLTSRRSYSSSAPADQHHAIRGRRLADTSRGRGSVLSLIPAIQTIKRLDLAPVISERAASGPNGGWDLRPCWPDLTDRKVHFVRNRWRSQ